MTEWINGKITEVIHWNKYLFSIKIKAPINKFCAGQYTKISMKIDGKRIQRAYSYVNAPNNKNLEFYLINIPDGKISSKIFFLQPNDELMIAKKSSGCFTLNKLSPCKYLWMFSTGTAIGPYLSILEDIKNDKITRFKKIILVHAVRYAEDLSYIKEINDLEKCYHETLLIKTIISREKTSYSLHGRIPKLIESKQLEKSVGFNITPSDSHVMICGNPDMVRDTKNILIKNYGMTQHFVKTKTGNITTENYW